MIKVDIKFGRRALPIVSQVRDAGYVVPTGSLQLIAIEHMEVSAAMLSDLYRLRILDRQDRDAARVRIEAKVRKLRLNKR